MTRDSKENGGSTSKSGQDFHSSDSGSRSSIAYSSSHTATPMRRYEEESQLHLAFQTDEPTLRTCEPTIWERVEDGSLDDRYDRRGYRLEAGKTKADPPPVKPSKFDK
jgi:hypothetical protein